MAKRKDGVLLRQLHDRLEDRELPYLKDGEHRDRRYLFFVVRNEGKSRRWVFRYTFDKKQKKIEIGTYPKVTLASARRAWKKYNEWLTLPVPMDPKDMLAKEASEAKDENLRVAHFVDQLRKQKRAKRSSQRSYIRYWDKIEKTIGDRRAIDVSRRDLIEKFEIEKIHYATPIECESLCGQLKAVFLLVHNEFPTKMPLNVGARLTSSFQPISDFHKTKHAPPWPPEDHAPFIQACREYKVRGGIGNGTRPDISLLTECLFLMGVRPQEPRLATWDEIDWGNLIWKIPYPHRKTGGLLKGKDRPVPITPSIKAILLQMKDRYPNANKTDVIFPASRDRKGGEPFFCEVAIREHIHDSIRWKKPLNPHSARNGFVAWALRSQVAPQFIERQLDHTLSKEVAAIAAVMARDLRGAYDQDVFEKARAEIMAGFDDHCSNRPPRVSTYYKDYKLGN